MSSTLLCLGHAADRTGPPIYLLHFLRWLRATHPGVAVEVALLSGGPLLAEFEALAPTSVYDGFPATIWDQSARAFLLANPHREQDWWADRRDRQLRRQLRQHAHCDVVYINGAPAAELARRLPPAPRVLLSHVHELEVGLSYHTGAADRAVLLDEARRHFVVSNAVADNLVERHGVDRATIAMHRGMIAPPSAEAPEHPSPPLPDGPVIGSCGSVDWRKGVDLFLRLAWALQRARDEAVTCVWVGGDDEAIERARRQAAAIGVEASVRFVGLQDAPLAWFRQMDVFVLPAREDPFPLVCLEAASVGRPIVAFEQGGIPELLRQGCGIVVPYPDVDAMAAQVGALLDDPGRRRSLGDRGRDLVEADHTVEVLAPRLWADIEPWLS